ncbi:hypothetical protein [Bradyrhizobium sp.]|jgi:hypothetical protein|uniref:hypothetical protein n=1 Tax=Bradyrhizobium sp. TaxID=376 RepID=UPI003C22B48C
MLPGFRFLFAAIMLSMSLLVFGLGAAALLRAAHESFASNSSWRAAPEVSFAQHPDTTLPMLATLRIEPTTMEKASEPAKVTAVPADQPPPVAESAGIEQVAALRPTETPRAEIAKAADAALPLPTEENMPAAEATSVGAVSPTSETTPAADVQKMTVVAAVDTAPAGSEPATAQAEPALLPPANPTSATPATAPGADVATTKIATLGGPPVDIADAASASVVKSDRAKPGEGVIKKRVHARRSPHRRRLAARARLLALQQLQANPFAQPQPFPPAPPSAPRQ